MTALGNVVAGRIARPALFFKGAIKPHSAERDLGLITLSQGLTLLRVSFIIVNEACFV